ncbi:hypothetical protein M0804_011753 [Polistes exclamans]|nr:hypothetical protein M0804_011753 [Polistes exclamans]
MSTINTTTTTTTTTITIQKNSKEELLLLVIWMLQLIGHPCEYSIYVVVQLMHYEIEGCTDEESFSNQLKSILRWPTTS